MEYLIIAVALIIISLIVIKYTNKSFNVEVNKLINYLGGRDNIIDAEANLSRLKVTLKDLEKVDKDGIQKLGAKGIVEIDNQLKIIFGKDARVLKKYIKDMRI
ncbi:MAG: PTS transporter subunit EIIB [Mollicutes bacterium]|jgi:glucose-like phosphotransferase system IIB component|nr:PTS transporter subunit EIIB [Mollicutes bacterium]